MPVKTLSNAKPVPVFPVSPPTLKANSVGQVMEFRKILLKRAFVPVFSDEIEMPKLQASIALSEMVMF